MVMAIRFCTAEYGRNLLVDTTICQQPAFQSSIKRFGQTLEGEAEKRVVLVMDGARWHLSESVKIPKGIPLYCLPSHSPQLQLAERLSGLEQNSSPNIAQTCYVYGKYVTIILEPTDKSIRYSRSKS